MSEAMTRITIEGPTFSAAHSGLHVGRFEPLHGHTFTTQLHLTGTLDQAGMVADFTAVKAALARAVDPLRRRTLMPGHAPTDVVKHRQDEGEVEFSDGHRRFVLPTDDVVVLPLPNTTTELLAEHLLGQLRPLLARLARAELHIAESPSAVAVAVAVHDPTIGEADV